MNSASALSAERVSALEQQELEKRRNPVQHFGRTTKILHADTCAVVRLLVCSAILIPPDCPFPSSWALPVGTSKRSKQVGGKIFLSLRVYGSSEFAEVTFTLRPGESSRLRPSLCLVSTGGGWSYCDFLGKTWLPVTSSGSAGLLTLRLSALQTAEIGRCKLLRHLDLRSCVRIPKNPRA